MPSKNVFTPLGANNVSTRTREINDFYATDPKAVKLLLQEETFNHNILEPMCGTGHISETLKRAGYKVVSSDIVDRKYGEVKDVFDIDKWGGDIISNPPYKGALEYIKHCMNIIPNGHKVAMFLKLLFLEGKERGQWFKDNPPKTIYVARSRLLCKLGGDFSEKYSSAVAYAWFVWEKGFKGEPVIRWIN
jgi:hypothetical protein